MINYYDVLGCRRDATPEELKRSYHERAKRLHPDKVDGKNHDEFLLLSKAWSALCDPDKRREYDNEIDRKEWSSSPMYCEIDLSEMECDGATYSYCCRCGGVYTLDKGDVTRTEEIRVGCDDCTLHIRIRVSGCEMSNGK